MQLRSFFASILKALGVITYIIFTSLCYVGYGQCCSRATVLLYATLRNFRTFQVAMTAYLQSRHGPVHTVYMLHLPTPVARSLSRCLFLPPAHDPLTAFTMDMD